MELLSRESVILSIHDSVGLLIEFNLLSLLKSVHKIHVMT